MKFNSFTLRELLLESRDGDWGKDAPKEGHTPYRVIRGGDFPDVENGCISKVPRCYLKESTVSRRTLQPEDLIIETAGGTRDRPTGRVLYISEEALNKFDLPVTCASFARFLRLDSNKVSPKYIFWLLRLMHKRGEMWKHQLQHTGVARFQFTQFADSESLLIPERIHQDRIVSFLDSLTDKLLVNRRMNRTLEAIAQAIFKSWFVTFEPVKAKQQAKAAGASVELAAMMALSGKSAAEIGQLPAAQRASLAETAALFPEQLVESELGLIPEGWHYKAISEVAENVFDGPHATPKPSEDGNVFLGVKNFTGTSLDFTNLRRISDADWPKWTKRVTPQAEDIVFTYEATLGFFAMIPAWLRCCLGRRTALVRPLPEKGNAHFLLHTFISRPFQILLDAHVNYGSTVNRILLSEFPSYPVLYPSDQLAKHFSKLASNFWQEIHLNQQQNQNLAQLRDTLLPKLLSGELTIPDAMAQTKEALS